MSHAKISLGLHQLGCGSTSSRRKCTAPLLREIAGPELFFLLSSLEGLMSTRDAQRRVQGATYLRILEAVYRWTCRAWFWQESCKVTGGCWILPTSKLASITVQKISSGRCEVSVYSTRLKYASTDEAKKSPVNILGFMRGIVVHKIFRLQTIKKNLIFRRTIRRRIVAQKNTGYSWHINPSKI